MFRNLDHNNTCNTAFRKHVLPQLRRPATTRHGSSPTPPAILLVSPRPRVESHTLSNAHFLPLREIQGAASVAVACVGSLCQSVVWRRQISKNH